MNVTQTQRVQALEAELALYTREAELRGKIDELRKEEIRALKESFDRMKEIADRSLKLAETSKPKASVGNVLLILLTGGIAALLLR
jgi:predicted nuclease with RNAse H fold